MVILVWLIIKVKDRFVLSDHSPRLTIQIMRLSECSTLAEGSQVQPLWRESKEFAVVTTTGSISVPGDFSKSILLSSFNSKMGLPLNSNLVIASLGEVFTFLRHEKNCCVDLRGTIAPLKYTDSFLVLFCMLLN